MARIAGQGLAGGAFHHRRVEGDHAGGRGVALGIRLVGAAFAQERQPVPKALDVRLAAQGQGGKAGDGVRAGRQVRLATGGAGSSGAAAPAS